MTHAQRTLAVFAYAALVIGSGVFRFVTQQGGDKALWFGLVMGGLGLVGAWLLREGRNGLGMAVTFVVLAFVGGWFGYEALVLKGVNDAEPRQLMVFGASIALLVLLVLPKQPSDTSVD